MASPPLAYVGIHQKIEYVRYISSSLGSYPWQGLHRVRREFGSCEKIQVLPPITLTSNLRCAVGVLVCLSIW